MLFIEIGGQLVRTRDLRTNVIQWQQREVGRTINFPARETAYQKMVEKYSKVDFDGRNVNK